MFFVQIKSIFHGAFITSFSWEQRFLLLLEIKQAKLRFCSEGCSAQRSEWLERRQRSRCQIINRCADASSKFIFAPFKSHEICFRRQIYLRCSRCERVNWIAQKSLRCKLILFVFSQKFNLSSRDRKWSNRASNTTAVVIFFAFITATFPCLREVIHTLAFGS